MQAGGLGYFCQDTRGAGTLSLGRGVSSGGNPRNQLGTRRFCLDLLQPRCRLVGKDVLNIVSICLSAQERKKELKTILEINGQLGLEELLLTLREI